MLVPLFPCKKHHLRTLLRFFAVALDFRSATWNYLLIVIRRVLLQLTYWNIVLVAVSMLQSMIRLYRCDSFNSNIYVRMHACTEATDMFTRLLIFYISNNNWDLNVDEIRGQYSSKLFYLYIRIVLRMETQKYFCGCWRDHKIN